MFDRLMNRPTNEIVVLILTMVSGFYLIGSLLFIMVFKLAHPNENIDSVVRAFGVLANTLFGAVIGFVAGKATPNGKSNEQKEE